MLIRPVGWATARLEAPNAIRHERRARILRIASIEAREPRRFQVNRSIRTLGRAGARKRTETGLTAAGRGGVVVRRSERGSTCVEAGYKPASACHGRTADVRCTFAASETT